MNIKRQGLATVNLLRLKSPDYRSRSEYRKKGHYRQNTGTVELKVKPTLDGPPKLENNWEYLRSLSDVGRVPGFEAVLPSQMDLDRAWPGEKGLMAAVLRDAIHVYTIGIRGTHGRARRMAADAADWMLNQDERWPFSFANICLVLGLDIGVVRAKVLGPADTRKC